MAYAPRIRLFQPWPTGFFVSGERYFDADNRVHVDTRWEVYRVSDDSLVDSGSLLEGDTLVRRDGLTLVEGELYRARLGYRPQGGNFSAWGENFIEGVPADMPFAPVAVLSEPAVSGVAPVPPTFPVAENRDRPIHEWTTGTGHIVRRLRTLADRLSGTVTWENIPTADKDALVAFLDARANAVQAFQLTADATDPLSSRPVFVRAGTVDVVQTGPGVWSVRAEVDESKGPAA